MNIEEIEQIKLDIVEKDGKIVCSMEVPPYNSHFPKKIRVRTAQVREFLVQKGYKLGENTTTALLDNRGKSGAPSATWSFDVLKEKPPAKKKTTKPRPRTPKPTTNKK